MIYICKGNVPAVFWEIRRKYNHYDELSHNDKNRLKSYLISEQGGICAYCMCRIKSETSTIEHYNPRSLKPELSLDYNNLFAVCTNGRNDTKRDRQCDVSRGDTTLNLNPCKESDMKHITYKRNGEIVSDIDSFNTDLTVTLNLNNQTLKNNRKSALQSALRAIQNHNKGLWKKEYIQKWYNYYIEQEPKSEFVGIILFELEKRLRRTT